MIGLCLGELPLGYFVLSPVHHAGRGSLSSKPRNKAVDFSKLTKYCDSFRFLKLFCVHFCWEGTVCPFKEKCTESKTNQKVVMRHIWKKYIELVEDYRHTPEYSDIYKLRKETIERVFADVKEKHSMRYTQYRGLAKIKTEATLRFACMNLKKLAKWKRIKGLLRSFIRGFIQILAQVIQKSVATLDLQPILSTV